MSNHTTIQKFNARADELYRAAMSDQVTAEKKLLSVLHKLNYKFDPEQEYMRCWEAGNRYIEQEYSGEASRDRLKRSEEFWHYWNQQWRKRNATLHAEALHFGYRQGEMQSFYIEDHDTLKLACDGDFKAGLLRITNKMRVY